MANFAQPQTDPSVEDRVQSIVIDVLASGEPELAIPGATLVQDLGADSLDFVELEFALEEAFGLSFSDADSGRLNRCGTIADVARLVRDMLARRPAAAEGR